MLHPTCYTAPGDILHPVTHCTLYRRWFISYNCCNCENLLPKSNEVRSKSFATAFKLLVIGSTISLVAGSADGLTDYLVQTHLTLATGMLTNSIAVVLGLTRIFVHFSTTGLQRLVKAALVPAFAGL